MDNYIKMNFKAVTENIAIIRNMVGILLLEYNPTISFIDEVKTLLSEGITNAIVHGYEYNKNELVELEITSNINQLEIIIKDTGKGIEDINLAKTPLYSTLKEEERSGLGFTIIQMFCDSLEVISSKDNGTILKIIKKW